MNIRPFHLAIPVNNLEQVHEFYANLLGCKIGRTSNRWIDFDFFGHQLTAHLVDNLDSAATNAVDGKQVPVRHFGVVLEWDHWHELAEQLGSAGVKWVIEPGIRFQGQPGEQATFFLLDPAGNALEFKSFKDDAMIFAKQ